MKKFLLVLCFLSMLSACGGGGGTPSTSNDESNTPNPSGSSSPLVAEGGACTNTDECKSGLVCLDKICSKDSDNDDNNDSGTTTADKNEICDNSIDDNDNDLIDCYDPDCADASNCKAGEVNSDAGDDLLNCSNYNSVFNSIYVETSNDCGDIVPSLMVATIYECSDGYLYSKQMSLDDKFPFDTGVLPVYVLNDGTPYITFDTNDTTACNSFYMSDPTYYIGITCFPKNDPNNYCSIFYEQPNANVSAWDTATGYYIVAQDGQYLGEISSNQYDSDSICNEYGTYGSEYSYKSIFNDYSKYGSNYSSYSAYNSYAYNPPIIYDLSDNPVYYLTKNTWKTPHIDPDDLVTSLGCPK